MLRCLVRLLSEHHWIAAVLLGATGFLINTFSNPIFPGIHLIVGGVAYLLAAAALGPGPGLVAAFLASLYTLAFWGHPYAVVIEPLAREKEFESRMDLCAPPEIVPTNPDKVRQILINLAGNAVKFTERGEVRIAVEGRNGSVVLTVADTGPGIGEADQARLFRPFEQLHAGLSRPHGGTGLGLYLSSQYAGLIGGRIEVESEPGRGSEFSLVLPRQRKEERGKRKYSRSVERRAFIRERSYAPRPTLHENYCMAAGRRAPIITISTLRFCARPSAVALSAIGRL